ncbi:MAG: hypothetical protein ACAI25_17325, partial [Planctomycetota bacterium]
MRSLRCRPIVLIAVALGAGAALPLTVSAEGEAPAPAGAISFESAPGLYAAAELGLGGRPLYQRLFPSGWPTTREFRKMALEDGEGAFADSIGAIMASGLGVPLEVSTFERWKLQDRQNTEGGKAPGTVSAHLTQRWDAFRQVSGLQEKADGFNPVFLPYRRGDPIPEKPFEELKPWTWGWQTKGQDAAITLDAVGLAMYAYSVFAQQQLAVEHKVEQAGTTQVFAGRTDVDGFLALAALECATAQLRELRDKLCMDAKGGPGGKAVLGPVPKNYDQKIERGEGLQVFFPHGVAATVNRATATYEVGTATVDGKMRLFDQAALILGLCELVRASTGEKGSGRFFVQGKKGAAFEPATAQEAIEVAIFVARSLRFVSWNPKGRCVSSFSTSEAGCGTSIRIEDAGLLLVALEQFLAIKGADKNAALAQAQKEMAYVVDRVTTFLLNVQKTSKPPMTGFCDTYDIAGESAADVKNGEEKRSLFAQGLVVRGLLAAKRACELPAYVGPNVSKHPEAKDAAMAVLKWLEDKRWDKARRAYVDEQGKPTKSRALDAAAVLGGLRDMALETNDARYLLRYKAYLGTLRARGLFLAETNRSRVAFAGTDPPQPGSLKTPAEAG